MIKWVNFLHIYQPPGQTKEVVDQVVKESYSLIVRLLSKYPNLRLTMNISGSLLELLEKFGHTGLIESIVKFAQNGQVEVVSSAMYHPILPLISEDEMIGQINAHNEISKKYFGELYKPRGFYFPEMAFSKRVEKVIADLGFEWIILDEIHCPEPVDSGVKYVSLDTGLTIIFRNRILSQTFPPEFIFENLDKLSGNIITAHDGELYGHWHKDDRGFYEKAFTRPDIKTVKASDFLKELTTSKKVQLRDASWESNKIELEKSIPFVLWDEPSNAIHKKLWEMVRAVEKILSENQTDKKIKTAKNHFSKGLASCAWWWASERKLGAFSPITWNPTEIEKGAKFILSAALSLESLEKSEKERIEKMSSDLLVTVWERHWSFYNPKS